jgi:hypothetical protein
VEGVRGEEEREQGSKEEEKRAERGKDLTQRALRLEGGGHEGRVKE